MRDRHTPGRLVFKRIATKKAAADTSDVERAVTDARPSLARKPASGPPAKPLMSDPRVITLKNARAIDLARTLSGVFPKEDGVLITPDPRTNSLILRGSAEQMMRVYRLLAELDEKQAGNEKPDK